jgi:hypothetical protein
MPRRLIEATVQFAENGSRLLVDRFGVVYDYIHNRFAETEIKCDMRVFSVTAELSA